MVVGRTEGSDDSNTISITDANGKTSSVKVNSTVLREISNQLLSQQNDSSTFASETSGSEGGRNSSSQNSELCPADAKVESRGEAAVKEAAQTQVEAQDKQDPGFESRLGFCALGVILTLGTYGYLQEKIMTVPYDVETTPECQDDEKKCLFQHSIFLVIFNRFFPCVVAFITMYLQDVPLAPAVPLWKFFLISFSNVFSTASRYEALKYLAFPTQMLGKSAKMVPVMIWSHYVGGKSFSLRSWMIAAGVTGGWVCYFLSGSHGRDNMSSTTIVIFGAFYMFAYLASDGFTSMFQEKLFSSNKNMSKYNQMAWVNFCSGVVSLVGVLWSGNFVDALVFCSRHPWFVWDAVVLSVSATLAQYVIYTTIKEYGAMALAACMNVRQVLSTLLSFYMYSHKISVDQVFSLVVVFGSLFMKQQSSKRKTD